MQRKVVRMTDGYGISFPLAVFQAIGVKPGDMVNVERKDGGILIKKNRKNLIPVGISSDFFDVLEETIKDHEDALKGLMSR